MSPLTREEQRWLLGLARRAIRARLAGESAATPQFASQVPSAALQQLAGAFVTLQAQGRLRGCVGYIQATKPLFLAVADAAVAAAFHDSRFSPVNVDEVGELQIEISVLTPLFPLVPEEVVVGEHGLLLSQGGFRGLLLPQVAVEHGWSREKFLEETCLKAGLPPDAWKKGARLEGFTASVFSEASLQAAADVETAERTHPR